MRCGEYHVCLVHLSLSGGIALQSEAMASEAMTVCNDYDVYGTKPYNWIIHTDQLHSSNTRPIVF